MAKDKWKKRLIALLVIIGQSLYLHRALLRPLTQISEEATRFSKENVASDRKLQETVRSRDEIGQLAASIDNMEEQIQSYVENLTRSRAHTLDAQRERMLAMLGDAAQAPQDRHSSLMI